MLKQTEGSHAVAEAVALCRPEVICAYPITPQTHIVEGLGEMVKTGALAPLRVHQRRIRVRRDVAWRSAPRPPARAPTRRPRARACCSWPRRSTTPPGLGLPIVMTVANRAIGAPINIWNDHSDAHVQRDCGWIQLFAETNQEALDLHIQAFRLGRGAVAAGDGLHGRLHPDARLRARRHADAGAGRRVPAAATSRARCSTRPSRCRSARWSARRPSRKCATSRTHKQLRALELIPQLAAEFRRRVRPRLRRPAARPTAPRTPRPSSSRWAR